MAENQSTFQRLKTAAKTEFKESTRAGLKSVATGMLGKGVLGNTLGKIVDKKFGDAPTTDSDKARQEGRIAEKETTRVLKRIDIVSSNIAENIVRLADFFGAQVEAMEKAKQQREIQANIDAAKAEELATEQRGSYVPTKKEEDPATKAIKDEQTKNKSLFTSLFERSKKTKSFIGRNFKNIGLIGGGLLTASAGLLALAGEEPTDPTEETTKAATELEKAGSEATDKVDPEKELAQTLPLMVTRKDAATGKDTLFYVGKDVPNAKKVLADMYNESAPKQDAEGNPVPPIKTQSLPPPVPPAPPAPPAPPPPPPPPPAPVAKPTPAVTTAPKVTKKASYKAESTTTTKTTTQVSGGGVTTRTAAKMRDIEKNPMPGDEEKLGSFRDLYDQQEKAAINFINKRKKLTPEQKQEKIAKIKTKYDTKRQNVDSALKKIDDIKAGRAPMPEKPAGPTETRTEGKNETTVTEDIKKDVTTGTDVAKASTMLEDMDMKPSSSNLTMNAGSSSILGDDEEDYMKDIPSPVAPRGSLDNGCYFNP